MHRTTAPPERGEVTTLTGLRVATVPRILIDLAAAGADDELRELITRAERRNGLTGVWPILERHRRRPGSARLRRLLDHHRPTAAHNSTLEDEFWAWYATQPDLPRPDETNLRLGGYEFDARYVSARLILELDSRNYHQARADMDHDRDKDAFVQLRGDRILRVTDARFRHDRAGIRDQILAFHRAT